MRKIVTFPCAGETLVGTLDEGVGSTALLIVSGGNEVRMGAHRGMALLAARLADSGVPVFRYDRRGVGDSSGENNGFAESAEDMAAAVTALRAAAPHITHIAGFGNCDGATALALFHKEAGIDRLILANPWVREERDTLPPAAAIRARYAERLRDPRTWLRALKGGINFRLLISGLKKVLQNVSNSQFAFSDKVMTAIESAPNKTIVLARDDATAIAFADAADRRFQVATIDTASHSFARAGDQAALEDIIRAALA